MSPVTLTGLFSYEAKADDKNEIIRKVEKIELKDKQNQTEESNIKINLTKEQSNIDKETQTKMFK